MPHLEKILSILVFFCILLSPPPILADGCDEAWQWLQEATALSDNSPRQEFYLDKALKACPDLVEALVSLAKVHLKQGRLDEALEEFEDAKIRILSSKTIMARPGSRDLLADCMLNIAEIYRLEGKLELAASQYTALLAMFPNYPAAQNRLQYVYKRLHRFDFQLPPYYRIVTNPSFNRISAFPMPAGKALFDFQFRYWRQTADITQDMFDEYVPMFYSPEERDVRIRVWIMGLRYGVTDKFTVGVVGKYFWKTVHVDLGAILGEDKTAELDASGFGDTVLMFKYHLWGRRKVHLSIFNLISLPTGDQNAKGRDKHVWKQEIWHWIPLGSGSVDFMPGLAFSMATGPVFTNANLSYKFTNGKNVGDEFNIGLAFMYQFNPSVYGDLEFNYRWQGHVRRKQHIIVMKGRPEFYSPWHIPAGPVPIDTWLTDRGGNSFFVSPSLQFFVAKGLKLEVGAKVPLIKQDEGWCEDYVIHAGFSKSFF